MSRKAKEYLISAVAVIGAIIALFIITLKEQESYPKLYRFGTKKYALECLIGKGGTEDSAINNGKNERQWVYRLISYNPLGPNSTKSISKRSLSFLDETGKRRYSIHRFDKSSLDKDSVWRFTIHKGLISSFSKEDESIVLKGNEKVFEIAEDFRSLTITTKEDQKLKLSCQPKTFK